MRILVGSTRAAKVEGAREALATIARQDQAFQAFALETHDLTHLAPRMPMSLQEILDGARVRAQAVWREHGPDRTAPSACFAVGLEGGLHPLPTGADDWSLQTWAAVTDGTRWGYGAGPSLLLPGSIAARVAGGEELGDVIDELAQATVRGTRGAWGILTHDLIGRRDAFRLAVIAAFAPFYNPRAFGA